MPPRSPRTRSGFRALLLAATLTLTAACGSQLSAEQVLAQSAIRVPDTAAPSTAPAGPSELGAPGATVAALTPAAPVETQAHAAAPAAHPAGHAVTPPTTAPIHLPTPQPAAGAHNAGCTTTGTGPIVIGNVGNYSGPGGAAVGQMPTGLQTWAAMINSQGGLCGRPVQVLIDDDGGDPAQYASLVRDLVQNRHIVAFVGNGAPLSAEGGLAYHRQSGVPVIGNDCTTGFWFTSPVLFPACTTPTGDLTGMVANGVALSHKTKVGYLYCTEAQGCLDADRILSGGAITHGGGTMVYRQSVSVTQVDFTAECQSARDAGAQLFFVGADPATLQRVAQSCARQNFFPQYISVSVTWSTDALATPGLGSVILAMPTMPFTGGTSPAVDQYHRAIAAFAPGKKPGPGLALGWTSGKLFELAATRAVLAGHPITPQTLIAALRAFHNETLGGLTAPLNFGSDGPNNGNCYFTMQGNGTGAGYTLPNGVKPTCR